MSTVTKDNTVDSAKNRLSESAKALRNPKAWVVVSCGALFYCYQFIIRVSPNIMSDEIMQNFLVDASGFGLIIGFYYWAYSGVQLPLGIIADKFGSRRLLSGAGVLCGLSCFMFPSTESFLVASICRFLMGMGAACGFLGTLKLGSLWFPPRWMGLVIGLTMVFGTLGAGLGGAPLRFLVETHGWQYTYYILGCIGLVLGCITFTFVRNTPTGDKVPYELSEEEKNPFAGLIKVLVKPQAWFIALFGMLMYVPITVMGDAWGVPYMQSIYNIDEKLASSIITTMFFGAACGAPVFAIFSDVILNRRIPMFVGALGALAAYLIIIFARDLPIATMYILFFIAGFCYTSKSLTFAAQCEIMPRSSSGVAVGFTNMVVMATGVILHPLIGSLLDFHWSGAIVDGTPIYTSSDYRFALSVVPISIAISLLALGFMYETHPGRGRRRDDF